MAITIVTTASSVPGTVVLAASQGPVTFTGASASGATPATSGLTLVGGAASTTSGGTAAAGFSLTGGAGAATTNGAAAGLTATAGGTTTVSGSPGFLLTGSGALQGLRAVGGATGSGVSFISGGGNGSGLVLTSSGSGSAINSTASNQAVLRLTGSVASVLTDPTLLFTSGEFAGVTITTNTIELGGSYGADNVLNGSQIYVRSTGPITQVRTIIAWNDSTKIATVDRAWDILPVTGDTVEIHYRNSSPLNSSLRLSASDVAGQTIAAALATANAITAASISSAAANKIADHGRRRTQANVEASTDGDALSARSEYGIIQQLQKSSMTANAGKLTIYKLDGTTELVQLTPTTDPAAEPVTDMA